MTYEDTATISRTEPATGANHITRAAPAVKYSKSFARCRIQEVIKSQQTDAQNEVDYDAVIFAAPDLLVLPGDSISLKRFGREDPNSRRLLAFQVVGRPGRLCDPPGDQSEGR